MSTSRMKDLVARLCALSAQEHRPVAAAIDWPDALDEDAWYMSPRFISLYGTDTYEALDEPRKKRLALLEASNFFSLNIHGERWLVAGMAERLYRPAFVDVSDYLHHFIDEENKHLAYFGGFCTRYSRIYPSKHVHFPRDHDHGEEDLLFFARVMIFEELVDHYNVRMARDEDLHPLARQINALHHADESRHLAFGRLLVRELFESVAKDWQPGTMERVQAHLGAYLRAVWYEYYNPEVYADLGLAEPFALVQSAMNSAASLAHRRTVSARSINHLIKCGLLADDYQL